MRYSMKQIEVVAAVIRKDGCVFATHEDMAIGRVGGSFPVEKKDRAG